MSKDNLLNYAKGGKLEPSYFINYEPRDGKIIITNCRIIKGKNHDIVWKMNLTGDKTVFSKDEVIGNGF